ncbi:RNA polymerase sigma factor [Sphingomonas sp. QA11]|uniref:RNA polymerase sigma factor n=1 Tax=Sphingomonas sp. QA11 TaxID=2950605 RepID=UPI002349CE2A|nr:RNA polymerase sigma factor [Sphingomonas sp. QA11]WCM25957.1 RNA polymerase sigma factor [Sphingomonas sp. QA11]
MSESTWSALKRLLVEEYDAFRKQLSRQVQSEELASDALQDTFVRLARGGQISDELESPRGYLYQIALNFARTRSRTEQRRLDKTDAEALFDAIADEQPGPEEVVAWQLNLGLLERVLAEMPRRRREVFIAAWIEGVLHREIAARHNLSLRMVQLELKQALEEITERLAGAKIFDFVK